MREAEKSEKQRRGLRSLKRQQERLKEKPESRERRNAHQERDGHDSSGSLDRSCPLAHWMRRKKQDEEGEEGSYWIMEDGYWFLYQGQWKSCDGGRSWLRIGERWESPEERERGG